MKKNAPRSPDSASILIEYILAVSLIGLAMMGVMKGFTTKTETVGARFNAEMGAGQIQCDPMQNPNCP